MRYLENQTFDRLIRLTSGLATVLLLGVGCGPEMPAEGIENTQGALGSTEGQQTVANWNELTTKITSTGNFLLTANIDATGKTWNPIDFTGTFDGNNKTISNLTINVSNSVPAGFFSTLNNAIVRRVRFLNLRVTIHGGPFVGGLAGTSTESSISDVGVEGTIGAAAAGDAGAAGGIVGVMDGGTMTRSYSKGAVNLATLYTGGLAGIAEATSLSSPLIFQCYSTATVTPAAGTFIFAGGLVGYSFGADIQDVYATGNVTGGTWVGGLVGFAGCDDNFLFVLNHGVYRGNVTDRTRSWAGTVGGVGAGTFNANCGARFDQLFWSTSADMSTAHFVSPFVDPSLPVQAGATDATLKAPTTANGGVFHFADNTFQDTIWNAGTNQQHHVLQNMPGGLGIQPR